MATINKTSFNPAEWIATIIPETAPGTAIVASMHKLNVDKPITVTDAPFIVQEPRTGTGRTLKAADWYVEDQGQIKTISLTGIADQTTFPILAENCVGIAEASGAISIPYNYSVAGFDMSDSVLSGNIYTLTFALVPPIASKARIYAGCIVSELNWVDDVAAEGGRRRFTATLITRAPISTDQANPTYANSGALYTTYYKIWAYQGANGRVQVAGDDVVMARLSVGIHGNPKINGVGLNGEGQNVNRGIPILDIDGEVVIKWDANTQPIFKELEDGTNAVILDIVDHTTLLSATTGFKADFARIPSDVNLSDEDGEAFITVPFRCMASTSGNIAQIPV